ncbi:MAG: rod shape-determining protein RodA [Candidatus Cloacimonetes bacterium]|nr:rod shape-determining protein RodA [Candidatus Cloacimonadota bacterium]
MINLKQFNWVILLMLIVIMLLGVVAIYTASSTKTESGFEMKNYYLKQLVWILIALVALVTIQFIPGAIFDLLILPGYILANLLLVIVLFMPEINGSHRWISFSWINFQPSELAKITSILLMSKLIGKHQLSEAGILLRSFAVILPPVILILLEPDLGTSIIFFVIMFAILAVSELPLFYLLIMASPIFSIITSFSIPLFIIYILVLVFVLYRTRLANIIIGFVVAINSFIALLTPFIWRGLKEYQQNRILTFIDPARDPFGAGYHIIQSKIAIGSGGFSGKGWLLGTQKNLNFLPEHHTDFIFSVIGEEFGFLGCTFILILYFLFLIQIAKSVSDLNRNENRYAVVGFLAYLTFQLFVNIGMNIGIVPATGIPLPFISYGGSNLLINVIAMGVILKYLNERSVFV